MASSSSLPAKSLMDVDVNMDVDDTTSKAPVQQTQPEPSSTAPSKPADSLGPWLHPIECLINGARDEPDALLINTYESGASERHSYRQVWRRAYSIAQGLRALAGWDDADHEVIGTFCESEVNWVFYSLAVWMLGKKTINFGLNLPPAARKAVCDRYSIKYILHHCVKPGRTQGVTLVDASTFPMLDDIPLPSLEACEPLDKFIAYLCTSGTTGIPKTYKYSCLYPNSLYKSIWILNASVGLCQAPSFSATLGFLLATLNLRGSAWIPDTTPNPVEKVRSIFKMLNDGLEYMGLPPSFLKLIIGVGVSDNRHIVWRRTRKIMLGSEIVPRSVVCEARRRFPNAEIQSGYASSESALIGAGAYFSLPVDVTEVPPTLVYKLAKPGVRCHIIDEHGNFIDRRFSNSGVLVFAVDPDHPVKDHPSFVNADPDNKIGYFGFLSDGSPRVCTMDWVEMVSENEFTVVGRFDQKVKVNGVYVDLNALEELVNQNLSHSIADCAFVMTSEKRIVMLYVPQTGPAILLSPANIILMTEELFALSNVAKVPIHNCFALERFPFNDSNKRDLKKLRLFAENVEQYTASVVYPALRIDNTLLSRVAAKISQIGSRVLGRAALDGRNYYIGGVGFDSLSAGRLALAIKDELDVEISPLILLSNGMTPTDVAQLAIDMLDDRLMVPPTVDLYQEAVRFDDAGVTADGLPRFVYPDNPRGIVLTGATGFLGAFLLYELASRFPSAKIYCLVRAKDEQAAIDRIFDTASKLILNQQQMHDLEHNIRPRIVGLPGDLAQDKWGLSDERWQEISEQSDVIVHNGAEVHWLYNYEALKGPNVLGTATALRLATTHHLKPLHYISTIGTLPMKGSAQPLEERMSLNWNLSGGYAQTKWVSEQLVHKARSRGVPVTIIRPAAIVGESRYGACNVDDYIWRYVKGCIQIGIAPSHATPVTLTMDPVDHVAKVVTAIVASEQALSNFVFHVSDSENSLIAEKKIFEIVNAMGWRVMFETREQFKILLQSAPSVETNALFPLMHMLMDMSVQVDNPNTRSIYPTPSLPAEKVVERCLRFLDRVKYLPAPAEPVSPLQTDDYPEVSVFGRTGRN
ncbi:male sterility protein-domain-containing protein [Polychytrium aggregatum]|uniref:male sterility protein-domain-containing protein n=1 Tax=Polychytrium aggregatum TaxID=110093 RepID=UPI0022FDEF78|nr:male sterility protein-domain-containing protein [Polychytrium aggregatum]KAI9209268.1 male sterility protein-domain-containing protein [Polychytrium aggregatum]